jgi:hypothetical protein
MAKETEIGKNKLSNAKIPADQHEHLTIPLHERILHKLHINSWLFWLIIGELLGGAAYLAVLLSHGTMRWIGQLALMYAIVFMIMGAGPIWINRQLETLLPAMYSFVKLPKNKIRVWLINELKRVFSPIGMGIAGLVIAALAIGSFIVQTQWYTEPVVWWGSLAGDWIVTIVVSILAFFAGMAFFMLIRLALMIHKISKLPLEMTIYQHPTSSISAIGTVLQRISMLVAVAYGLVSLTAIPLSPFRNEMGMMVEGWLIFAGIVVIAFFIFPQYRIHIAMKNAKADKIRIFSSHISETLENAISNPSSEKIAYVKELFELYKYLLDMPEWPFNTKSFISLVTVIVIPVLLSIVQHLISP